MLLFIDNYDSFTYNIVQYLAQLGQDVAVRCNDEITLDEIAAECFADGLMPEADAANRDFPGGMPDGGH